MLRIADMMGRWVWMTIPREGSKRFLGFVYLDAEAGPSAKGGFEGAPKIAERPEITVRLPQREGSQVLVGDDELARLALPATPSWLHFYGPQPKPDALWRRDPLLRDRFHEAFIDDLQIVVHDGEPRRTQRAPEVCWVRVNGAKPGPRRAITYAPEATKLSKADFDALYGSGSGLVYTAQLLNQPHHLSSVRQGGELQFLSCPGSDLPLMVTERYLQERASWRIQPCDKCGLAETLDPPSVMIETRFPGQADAMKMEAFTSFCARCGGMQMLVRLD